MTSSLLVASWVMETSDQIKDDIRQHFTNLELGSGSAILAALLVISLVKKIIFMAIVIVVLAGIAIAYQNGAFDSLLDNVQNKKTT